MNCSASATDFLSPKRNKRDSIKKSPMLSPTLLKTEGQRKGGEEERPNLLPINEQDSENEHSCAIKVENQMVYKLEQVGRKL